MKALSLDLRNRIVQAYSMGSRTQGEVAEVFGLSERTVKRLDYAIGLIEERRAASA